MDKDTKESLLNKNVSDQMDNQFFAQQFEVTQKGDINLNNDDFPPPQDDKTHKIQEEKQLTIPEIMEQASALEQHAVQEFPFNSKDSKAQIGRDSNLVYAPQNLKLIQFWSLNGRKDVNSIEIQENVHEIKVTDYFIIAQVTDQDKRAYFIYDAFSLKYLGKAESARNIMIEAKSTKDLLIISDSRGIINTISINDKSRITYIQRKSIDVSLEKRDAEA
ncbi:UNKNOWN [Stylonychia lemnae]|uniref:Uncharacterized protein n=1 Tax=Stylonychia lemnae TaxID=5949 RepID=A0A078AQZ1_STYLE|nr:UNKNOWN [Stylonychia lemnae]|eukprot:CDW83667.1 UNKNOWN [Stylonychia lemnae]